MKSSLAASQATGAWQAIVRFWLCDSLKTPFFFAHSRALIDRQMRAVRLIASF